MLASGVAAASRQTSKQVLASSEKATKQKQFSNNWGNNPARWVSSMMMIA
jgi:hypothetical protein